MWLTSGVSSGLMELDDGYGDRDDRINLEYHSSCELSVRASIRLHRQRIKSTAVIKL